MIADSAVYPIAVAVSDQCFAVEIDSAIKIIKDNKYTGAYEVTPNQETQILRTAELSMTDDVTIYPIPSNYGLVTWNGSILTVS